MGSNASKCANVKQVYQLERNLEKIVVSKEEWKDIRKEGSGVRMYKGLQTLFYNGEKLWEGDFYSGIPIVYDRKERETWQQVIVFTWSEDNSNAYLQMLQEYQESHHGLHSDES